MRNCRHLVGLPFEQEALWTTEPVCEQEVLWTTEPVCEQEVLWTTEPVCELWRREQAFTSSENGTKFPWFSVTLPRHCRGDTASPQNRFVSVKE
jgi:hypothetical protein